MAKKKQRTALDDFREELGLLSREETRKANLNQARQNYREKKQKTQYREINKQQQAKTSKLKNAINKRQNEINEKYKINTFVSPKQQNEYLTNNLKQRSVETNKNIKEPFSLSTKEIDSNKQKLKARAKERQLLLKSNDFKKYKKEEQNAMLTQYLADMEQVTNEKTTKRDKINVLRSYLSGLEGATAIRNYKLKNGEKVHLPSYNQLKSNKVVSELGSFGKSAHGSANSIGGMTPAMLASLSPFFGRALGTATTFTTTYNNAYNQKLLEGYTPKEAKAYSTVNASLESGLSLAMGGVSKKIGGKMSFLSSNLAKISEKAIKNPAVRRMASSLGAEEFEELTQMVLDPINEYVTLGKYNNLGEALSTLNLDDTKVTALSTLLTVGITEGRASHKINVLSKNIDSINKMYGTDFKVTAEGKITNNETKEEVSNDEINNFINQKDLINAKQTVDYVTAKQTIEENNKIIEEKKTQATLLNNNLKNKTNTTQNVAETQAQIDTLVNEIQQLKTTNTQISQEIQSNPQFRQIEALNLTLPEIQQLASGNLDINEKLQQVKEMQPYTAENPAITIPKQKGTRNYKIQQTLYQIEQNMTPELLSQPLNIEEIENTSYDPLDRLANLYISAKQNLNNSVDTNGIVTMLAKIAEDKGYNIIFNSNLATNENGRIVSKNGVKTIELNPNSVRSKEFILMHELTHAVGTEEIWQDIIDYAKADSKVAKMLNDKIKAYQEQTDYTDEEIQEEVMCDMMGELLGSQEYINHLSQEKPTLFEKILKWLNDFLGRTDKNSYEHEYLSKIKADFEEAYRTNETVGGELKNSIKNSIETNKKGQQYVKADRQVIKGDNPAEWQEQVESYINEEIRKGKDVNVLSNDGDILTITKDTAGKAKFRNDVILADGTRRKMTDEELLSKLVAETHIDELAKISKKGKKIVPDYKNHSFAKDGFNYRTAFFKDFDDKYYKVTMSVGKNGSINTIYNIGQMKDFTTKKGNTSLTAQRPNNQKVAPGTSITGNIPQNTQKVNSGISNNSNMQNKEKNAVKNSIELDNSSFSLDELPKVKEGYTRLYRGLNNDYDSNYDRSTLDSPNGYDTLTDNYDLAKQYGKNVYYIDIPTNQIANSVIDENPNSETYGDRHLVYKDDKPASINGVSGNEYLLYTDHDSFDSNNYHKVENNTNLEYNNSGIERKFNTIEESIEDDPRKQTYSKYNTSIDFFNLEYEEMSKAIALGSKYALEAQRLGFNNYSFNDNKYQYYFDILNKENNAFGITNVYRIGDGYNDITTKEYSDRNSELITQRNESKSTRSAIDNSATKYRATSTNNVRVPIKKQRQSRVNESGQTTKENTRYSKELDNSSFSYDNQGRKLSKQQREYFKDSKVVDDNDNLMVMYHGSQNDFNVFDINKTSKGNALGRGFYFTSEKNETNMYANNNGKVFEEYLNIKKPFIWNKNSKRTQAIIQEAIDTQMEIKDILKNKGYDGAELLNYSNTGKVYVAFYSNQIKNVDNTNPTEDSDIRYSIEPTMNDATTMDSKSLKALTKNMKQQLGLNRVQVNELEQIIQKHSTSGELNRESIYNDIKDRFSKQSIESDIQEVKDVQKLIKDTKIDVSQNIKNDIADYNKLKQRNFGKIKFSSDGQPVDVVYQELSNEYPNYFPNSIYNESDQFKKIVEVANYDNKTIEEYDIDDNYIRETSDYIYDSIRDYHLDQRKKLANEELDLINREYSKKPKKNTPIKYTDEQIAKILDRGSTKNIGFKEDIRRKLAITTANVIDKGYYIEKLARKTGNSRLDALYDNTLFSSSQAQEIIGNGRFEVNTPQKIGLKATLKTKKGVASTETKVGDSLYDIYEPIENSGKQKEFEEYMYHKLNVERMTLDKRYGEENKKVFAESIGADKSREFIKKIEAKNPEFKEWAKKVYKYESNDKYSDMATLVESGIMSKEQAEYLKEKYPSYVPIIRDIEHKQIDNMINGKKITVKTPVKKAKGGNQNMIPLKEAMAIKTLMVQRSANMNKLGLELMKTLNPEVTEQEMSADKVLEEMTNGKETFTERNGLPTMSVFENGVKKTFEIPEEIYLALKPINSDSVLNWTIKPVNAWSNVKRGVLTEYNVAFMLRNIVKDTQDVVLNSKHPVKTMAKFPEALAQLVNKGYWYKEMEKQGIFNNSFFDGQKKFDPYMKKESKAKTILKMPLTAISKANNIVERIPRVAEYIASREAGYSVEEASLHSQRVTTNFKAGGTATKALNRNGFTFLNAGVQGMQQQVRNIQEANAEGLKGYLKLASKVAIISSPVLVAMLNNMLFGDDDDYEKISDYEKNNYYFIAKFGDNDFIKIPRGRMAGVIQNVERQLIDVMKGKDKFDLDEAWDLFVNNVVPNNPITNNVLSPFIQTKLLNKNDPGKTWYGEDLVPKSLQGDGTQAKDEYDEGIDAFSIWLGDKLNLSPIKINNLIDQNTGVIGDIILPLLTLETKTRTANPLVAPFESSFTSDRVYDNKYPSELYKMKDELEEKAKDKGLTQEDKAKQQYLNSISSEAYSYYNKIKSIQSSTTMTKSKKYEEVRKVREQMNAMIEDKLKGIDKITTSGNYSEVGEGKNKKYFYKNYKGNYTEVKEKELAKLDNTSMTTKDKDEYFKTKSEVNQYMYNTQDSNKYANAYNMILNSKTSQEGKAILYNNNSGFWAKDATNLASVNLVDGFLQIEKQGLKSDYKNGKVVTGSKQKKIIKALNKLDGYSATEKAIILKTYYNTYKTYDNKILKYIDKQDISKDKKKSLLESLGFKVKGNSVSSASSKVTPYKSSKKTSGSSKRKTSTKKKSAKSVSVTRKKVTPIKISTSSKKNIQVTTNKKTNKKIYQNALELLLKK